MKGAELEQRSLDMLIERVREERFPSVMMMSRIEASLRTREQVEKYSDVLLEKIESSRFPSTSMLTRFNGLVGKLGESDRSRAPGPDHPDSA